MKPSLQLIGEASRIRDLASQVWRLANVLTIDLDKKRLQRHAQEMAEQADRLQAGNSLNTAQRRKLGKPIEKA